MNIFAEPVFGPFFLILLAAVVGLTIRVILNFVDKANIREAAAFKGWRDIEVSWAPFAPGWLFEKGERHYEVIYRDKSGKRRQRFCKTGLFTGVYWRDQAV